MITYMRSVTLVLTSFLDAFLFSFHFLASFVDLFQKQRDVGDFKWVSISGITGSQIHCISPGGLLAYRFR